MCDEDFVSLKLFTCRVVIVKARLPSNIKDTCIQKTLTPLCQGFQQHRSQVQAALPPAASMFVTFKEHPFAGVTSSLFWLAHADLGKPSQPRWHHLAIILFSQSLHLFCQPPSHFLHRSDKNARSPFQGFKSGGFGYCE